MGILEGRVAIVTGASRGIGAAIAERLAREGAAVVVTARTEQPADHPLSGSIFETARAIEASGGVALPVRADLSQPEDRRMLVERAERELGPVDILVNNAAVSFYAMVEEFSDRRYALMFEVQVTAPFHLAQLVLPGMRQRRRGWILNVSSGAARHPALRKPPIGFTVYGMCKAALERFSTGLAAEVVEEGIAVNALSPSEIVATPGVLFHRLIPEGSEDKAEPVEVMAEAAFALCGGGPAALSGRIARSQELLAELGTLNGSGAPQRQGEKTS